MNTLIRFLLLVSVTLAVGCRSTPDKPADPAVPLEAIDVALDPDAWRRLSEIMQLSSTDPVDQTAFQRMATQAGLDDPELIEDLFRGTQSYSKAAWLGAIAAALGP